MCAIDRIVGVRKTVEALGSLLRRTPLPGSLWRGARVAAASLSSKNTVPLGKVPALSSGKHPGLWVALRCVPWLRAHVCLPRSPS